VEETVVLEDNVVVEVSDVVLAVVVEVSDAVSEDMVMLEVSDVVLAVAVEVSVELVVPVDEERVVLEVPVAVNVKLVVDDSVDVVRPSQVSSQIS
jgi:hypothetical protein